MRETFIFLKWGQIMKRIVRLSIALLVAAVLLGGCHYPYHHDDHDHGGKDQEQKY